MLSDFQVDLLKKYVDREYKEADADVQTFDLQANVDRSLSYSENKVKIAQLLKELGIEKIEKKVERISQKTIKEDYQRQELEQIKVAEEHAREEQLKAIEEIKQQPPNIKRYFEIPRKLINSFLDKQNQDIAGFILKSEAGLGKSKLCTDIMREKGWKLGEDFEILSGYATPLELYAFLFKNADKKAILFDDVAKMFDNDLSKGLLLSALWNPSGKRRVSYLSSSEKLVDDDGHSIPRSFIFNSKILWCLNELPLELMNIKSRCYFYEISFTYKTRIKIIYEICKLEKIPLDIADYIKDSTNEAYQIDFRLPLKMFGLYKSNVNEWQRLAKAIIKPDEDLLLIKQLLAKNSTVSEAIQDYVNQTGHSRATFFRRKKLLIQNIFYSEDEISEAEVIKEIRKVSKSQKVSQMGKVKSRKRGKENAKKRLQ